jgi:hypothetical protein
VSPVLKALDLAPTKTLVIPNRAKGPVRNLLFLHHPNLYIDVH